jgi:hypothetical protein
MNALRSSNAFYIPSVYLGHESAEGYEAPHESLNIFNVLDWTHLGDGRDLVRVCFDVMLGDDVP